MCSYNCKHVHSIWSSDQFCLSVSVKLGFCIQNIWKNRELKIKHDYKRDLIMRKQSLHSQEPTWEVQGHHDEQLKLGLYETQEINLSCRKSIFLGEHVFFLHPWVKVIERWNNASSIFTAVHTYTHTVVWNPFLLICSIVYGGENMSFLWGEAELWVAGLWLSRIKWRHLCCRTVPGAFLNIYWAKLSFPVKQMWWNNFFYPFLH